MVYDNYGHEYVADVDISNESNGLPQIHVSR